MAKAAPLLLSGCVMSDQFFSNLDLTVTISADEWAHCQRRLAFLNALSIELTRRNAMISEWLSASELVALRLPGLPRSVSGMTRHAQSAHWQSRQDTQAGRRGTLYHVASLPNAAFEHLVSRSFAHCAAVETATERPTASGGQDTPRTTPTMPVVQSSAGNTAPPWVLPLMRLMKGRPRADLGAAWSELPRHLPPGTNLPPIREAAEVLLRLGLA